MAHNFPRSEELARTRLLESCKNSNFATLSRYQYQRGGSDIVGLSVVFSREAARVWGNIRSGFIIVGADNDSAHIRGYAWDLETNSYICQDTVVKRLVQRKKGDKTEWVIPDERDWRETLNSQGARVERNCLLHVLPRLVLDECLEMSQSTISKKIAADPEGEKKKVIDAFASLHVLPSDLERYLGHELRLTSPQELEELRGVYSAVKNGEATWTKIIDSKLSPKEPPKENVTLDDITGGEAQS